MRTHLCSISHHDCRNDVPAPTMAMASAEHAVSACIGIGIGVYGRCVRDIIAIVI